MSDPLSFCTLLHSVYGPTLVNRHDTAQVPPIFETGRTSQDAEIEVLLSVASTLGPDAWALDVGAHNGLVTVPLARVLASSGGKVLAFEPQLMPCYMLAGNIALSGMLNARAFRVLLSDASGTVRSPDVDPRSPRDFGDVRFDQLAKATHPGPMDDFVKAVPLDSLGLERADLLKIDAPGMEMQVLRGAIRVLQRCRPWVWIECVAVAQAEVVAFMRRWKYTCYDASPRHLLCVHPQRLKDSGATMHFKEWRAPEESEA